MKALLMIMILKLISTTSNMMMETKGSCSELRHFLCFNVCRCNKCIDGIKYGKRRSKLWALEKCIMALLLEQQQATMHLMILQPTYLKVPDNYLVFFFP